MKKVNGRQMGKHALQTLMLGPNAKQMHKVEMQMDNAANANAEMHNAEMHNAKYNANVQPTRNTQQTRTPRSLTGSGAPACRLLQTATLGQSDIPPHPHSEHSNASKTAQTNEQHCCEYSTTPRQYIHAKHLAVAIHSFY